MFRLLQSNMMILLLLGLLSQAASVVIRSYNSVNFQELTTREQLEALFPDERASTNIVSHVYHGVISPEAGPRCLRPRVYPEHHFSCISRSQSNHWRYCIYIAH